MPKFINIFALIFPPCFIRLFEIIHRGCICLVQTPSLSGTYALSISEPSASIIFIFYFSDHYGYFAMCSLLISVVKIAWPYIQKTNFKTYLERADICKTVPSKVAQCRLIGLGDYIRNPILRLEMENETSMYQAF